MRIAHACLVAGLALLPVRFADGEQAPAGSTTTCGSEGAVATVALAYNDRILGELTGVLLEVRYPAALTLPGKGGDASVRDRVSSELPSTFRLSAAHEGGRLRMIVTTSDKTPIAPGTVARVRFDCTAGAAIRGGDFSCRTDQVSDDSGALLDPERAREVTCAVTLGEPGAAAKPPTS